MGCHVAAMCAQTLEKSLKGCFILVGMRRANDHRPDKSLTVLVLSSPKRHRKRLSRLFDQNTRRAIEELLSLTPGGQHDRNVPNTEYPWTVDGVDFAPAAHPIFENPEHIDAWLKLARRVHSELEKIRIVDRMRIRPRKLLEE